MKTTLLHPAKPTPRVIQAPLVLFRDCNKEWPYIMTSKPFKRECISNGVVFAFISKEQFYFQATPDEFFFLLVVPLLQEFTDIVPIELTDDLPPMRDIQHDIDLVRGS